MKNEFVMGLVLLLNYKGNAYLNEASLISLLPVMILWLG